MSRKVAVALVCFALLSGVIGWCIFRAISPPAPYAFIPDVAPKVASNFRGLHIWVFQFPGRFDKVVARGKRELGIDGDSIRSAGARTHKFNSELDEITILSGKMDLVPEDTSGLGLAGNAQDPNWVTVVIRSAAEPKSFWQRLRFGEWL